MTRFAKTAVVVGLPLMLLAVIRGVYFLCPQQVPSPRLSLIGFTNSLTGMRVAALSVSNASRTPVLFCSFVELPAGDGDYVRLADSPPEMPPTALAPGGTTELETEVPDPGIVWRLHLLWQPKPSSMACAYARAVDGLLGILHRTSYPIGWVPSAFVWQHTLWTPKPAAGADPRPIVLPSAALPRP